MEVVRYHRYGGPEVLQVESIPDPHAGPGTIRIRTAVVGVNPIDFLLRRGDLREVLPMDFPVVPGRDAAGVVDEVGEGVDGVVAGDAVFGLGGVSDTYRELAVLSAWAPLPIGWTLAQGAAAGLPATTAIRAVRALEPLEGPLLIDGASGAVGGAAAAVALDRGVVVVGTARVAEHEYLRSLGIVPVEYGAGLADRVEALGLERPARALDASGAGSLEQLVAIVGDADRVVTVAQPADAVRLDARFADGENDADALRLAGELGARGAYSPRVGAVFPFTAAVDAHRRAERGRQSGRILIAFGEPSR